MTDHNQAKTFPSTNNLKETHCKLCASLETATEDDKAVIETTIRNLEHEIQTKVSSLLQEGEQLSSDDIYKYQEAYEKFCEAQNLAVDKNTLVLIEEKKKEASKSAKTKELNNEAVRLCGDDQYREALDKFEEALSFVNNDFLFNLIEGNIEVVNGRIFKKYLKDGENGMSKMEQVLLFMAKLMEDVASFKVRFD